MKKLFLILFMAALLAWGITGCTGDSSSGNANGYSPSGSQTANISLGDSIIVNGSGATVDGSKVLIESPGTYTLSGTLDDGMIKVDAGGGDVNLILAGASITNSEGPAILIDNTSLATLTLQNGSSNKLTDGGSSDYDAALYCAGSLAINGDGSLLIDANNNEGISSTMHITIDAGHIEVRAVEDGLNANNDGVSEITVNGGYLYVESENGDGIDSNGKININGGTVIALSALADASGGLDADGEVTISGGTVIATGSQISTPGSNSPQKSILAAFSGTQAANTLAAVQNGDSTILTFAPSLDFQQLLFSSASLEEGTTYDIYTGGSSSGEAVNGLYSDGVYTPGALAATVDTSSITNARQMGPQGGPHGDPQRDPQDMQPGLPPDMGQGTPPGDIPPGDRPPKP